MPAEDAAPPTVYLEAYTGSWPQDDPDANFKREVAEYTKQDPLATLRQLSANTGIPLGALVSYALVKWTAEGSEALLALGPRTVNRMWAAVERAESEGSDAARLAAYDQLRQMISWLRVPLEDEPPAVSP
jgi:hypothetical protein